MEGSTSAVGVADLLTDAGAVIPDTLSIVWEMVTSNPLLLFFAGAGIVSMGFTYWRKARGAAGRG